MRVNMDALNRVLAVKKISFEHLIRSCGIPPLTGMYIQNGFPVSFTYIIILSNFLKISPARLY